MRAFNYTALVGALVLMTACGGAGNSAGGGSASAQEAIQKVDINQLKVSVNRAQASLSNAQDAMSTIFSSSGSFNWSIFFGGVDFTTLGANTQTCLKAAFPTSNIAMLVLTGPQDIANALKCILDDVVQVAGIATTDLNSALTILNQGLASATPGSPDAVAIQEMITQVQTLESEYKVLLATLSSQVGLAVTFLDTLPSVASGVCPVPGLSFLCGFAVSTFVQPLVVEIIHFQDQLQSL